MDIGIKIVLEYTKNPDDASEITKIKGIVYLEDTESKDPTWCCIIPENVLEEYKQKMDDKVLYTYIIKEFTVIVTEAIEYAMKEEMK